MLTHKGRLFTFDGENCGGDGEVREVGGVFPRFLVYLDTIIFSFYTELKYLLASLLKTYPCEGMGGRSYKLILFFFLHVSWLQLDVTKFTR